MTGYSATTVPEHVLGMIFALKHSLAGWQRRIKSRVNGLRVNSSVILNYPMTDVKGSTLGVFGKGCLGTEVGRLAELLGMKVLYAEHRNATTCREGYTPFEEVLKQADILTLHCALTETTKNLINQETLSLCKKGAYLINTGRGPLIDEQAVCDALKSGQLGGAALDVLVKEPPEKNNPLIELAKTMPNLIITPHIAWASDSAVTTLVGKVMQNIEEFVQQLNKKIMNFPISIYIALRYWRAKSADRFGRLVTNLASLGIVLGVMALIIVLSVMNGLEGYQNNRCYLPFLMRL